MLQPHINKNISQIYLFVSNVSDIFSAEIKIFENEADTFPTDYANPSYSQAFTPINMWNAINLASSLVIKDNVNLYVGYNLVLSGEGNGTHYTNVGADNPSSTVNANASFMYFNSWSKLNIPCNFNIRAIVDNKTYLLEQANSKPILFPNPAQNNLNIVGTNVQKVDIYDFSGAKVTEYYNQNSIDVSNLESGLYFLKAFYDNDDIVMKFNILR